MEEWKPETDLTTSIPAKSYKAIIKEEPVLTEAAPASGRSFKRSGPDLWKPEIDYKPEVLPNLARDVDEWNPGMERQDEVEEEEEEEEDDIPEMEELKPGKLSVFVILTL